MRTYAAKRLLLLFPVILGVTFLTFFFLRIAPGDVLDVMYADADDMTLEELDELRKSLGMDKPFHIQYVSWIGGLLRLDAGTSLWTRKPVVNELVERLPVTVELALLAFLLQLTIAVPIGVFSATHQDKAADQIARFFAILGIATPNFWLGIMAIVFFAAVFGWIPPLFGVARIWEEPFVNLQQFFLPALILGTSGASSLTRLTRNTMLEVMRQDYIRTGFSKGLTTRRVWYGHALKNAMIPVITNAGHHLGYLLGGTVIIENIFALPGVGQLTLDAIHHRDFTQLEINVLFFATVFVLVNLIVDLSYGWFDPRIRYR